MPWPLERGDASARWTATSADIVFDFFAFAGMKPRANFDPERTDSSTIALAQLYRPRGAVERNQKSVANRVGLTSAKAHYVLPDRRHVGIEEITPAAITNSARPFRSNPQVQ